jgi:hypothetical protein
MQRILTLLFYVILGHLYILKYLAISDLKSELKTHTYHMHTHKLNQHFTVNIGYTFIKTLFSK